LDGATFAHLTARVFIWMGMSRLFYKVLLDALMSGRLCTLSSMFSQIALIFGGLQLRSDQRELVAPQTFFLMAALAGCRPQKAGPSPQPEESKPDSAKLASLRANLAARSRRPQNHRKQHPSDRSPILPLLRAAIIGTGWFSAARSCGLPQRRTLPTAS
jgi:hypothetical protein